MAPLPRKTSYAAQVAPQRCPILHMSKRKGSVHYRKYYVNAPAVRDGVLFSS